jgi:hypothetical protein
MMNNWIRNLMSVLISALLIAVLAGLFLNRTPPMSDIEIQEHLNTYDLTRPDNNNVIERPARKIAASQSAMGMTWEVQPYQHTGETNFFVGCKGCDPYRGDTPCATKLPLLCFIYEGTEGPPTLDQRKAKFSWSGGRVAVTDPVAAETFPTLMDANNYCKNSFGKDWRVAEFHDGFGGWSFFAAGSLPKDTRFWVDINDQRANCWSR